VWPLPADADYSMIFEVDFQPGAGSQPWALQCRLEHEDQIPPGTACTGSVARSAIRRQR